MSEGVPFDVMFSAPKGDIDVSFEFFPPANEKMQAKLWSSIERLAPLQPRFVSVTYGAGGSTRERTHETVKRIVEETQLTPAAHLTCVGSSRDEVDAIARDYWDAGVRHIVALRGDITEENGIREDGYANAAELVEGLAKVAPFDLSVAAYPEVHPDAETADADLEFLLRKIDAGASRAITQFFFSPEPFLRLRDALAAKGRDIELVPGILPVTNVARAREFAGKCGTEIPGWLDSRFEGLDETPRGRDLVAAMVSAHLCGQLYAEGVRHFHFYTLNRAEMSWALCHMLGCKG